MGSVRAKYKRVVLKLSGEILAGEAGYGIDPRVAASIAEQVREVQDLGVELAIVIGGGNICAARPAVRSAWTAPPPTTWACSRR